jgi:RNA ligase (TIGR02306 family)
MRHNSFVGVIKSLSPIKDADRIEAAEVVCGSGGKWAGVVKKGDFCIGAVCAVFLPDAMLPERPEFEFMRKSRFVVKQQRLRGCRSEVLIMPYIGSSKIGDALDLELGIGKYEKPIDASVGGDTVGNFPSFIPKTDEPNFQGVPHMVEALIDKPFYVTEKADGSSGTIFKLDGKIRVCSRNLELKESPGQVGWLLVRKYELDAKIPEGMAIQFEMVGGKIQGNPMGLPVVDMRVFNLYSIQNHRYLDYSDLYDFCKKNELPMVAFVCGGQGFHYGSADSLQALAKGNYANGKPREGVVIRPMVETICQGERLSFKVINLEYKG